MSLPITVTSPETKSYENTQEWRTLFKEEGIKGNEITAHLSSNTGILWFFPRFMLLLYLYFSLLYLVF